MSDNIDSVTAMYAVFCRGDVPAIQEQMAPDVTWRPEVRCPSSLRRPVP